jgi:hypothetical protein
MAKKDKGRINVGSLKLGRTEIEPFHKALDHYGFESIANFLRQVALALAHHHSHGDWLRQPLRFVVAQEEPENSQNDKTPKNTTLIRAKRDEMKDLKRARE